jgi:hypothetical protein
MCVCESVVLCVCVVDVEHLHSSQGWLCLGAQPEMSLALLFVNPVLKPAMASADLRSY